jgi:hypothetical protein
VLGLVVSDRRAGMALIAAAPRSPRAGAARTWTRGSGLWRSDIKVSIMTVCSGPFHEKVG